MGVNMSFLDFFDSKIKDIMYDVVGLLFPGAFCLLITIWIFSIEKIHNILNYLGIPENTIQISGFSEISVFLMFAYFYGVLLRGIYESFFMKWIEPYTLEDYNAARMYIPDSSIKEKKGKLTLEERKKVKSTYKKLQNKIKKENLEENKEILRYLDKYIEKRNIYRIIFIQCIFNSIFILLLLYNFEIKSFDFKNNIIKYLIFIIVAVMLIFVFYNYIKQYFKRINNQILMGIETVPNKKGE